MKAWMAATGLLTFAFVAASVYSPVLTETWIVKDKGVSMNMAIVFTVGISDSGPIVRIRHVSALREDELYHEIHEAAKIAQSNPLRDTRHWGGGQSWCNGEDCQRFYIFVGTSLKHAGDTAPTAICQLPAASVPESSRRM
jgi:hypothetical protein